MNVKAETAATRVMDDPRDTLFTGIERRSEPRIRHIWLCCVPVSLSLFHCLIGRSDLREKQKSAKSAIDIREDERRVASADASHLTG